MQASIPDATERKVWQTLARVADPEIPVISVLDLGIVRKVEFDAAHDKAGAVIVTVTPTYSGCPATEVIAESIRCALAQDGFANVVVKTQLSPAWTTDWLSNEGREKLRQYGIAPPVGASPEQVIDISRLLKQAPSTPRVQCPRCGSTATDRISEFGSTPCKALYRCGACKEPFDYFKCH